MCDCQHKIRRCSSVVEQRSPKPRVQGSNPCSGAIIYNTAQCAAHSEWQQGVIVSRSGVMLTCDIPAVVIHLALDPRCLNMRLNLFSGRVQRWAGKPYCYKQYKNLSYFISRLWTRWMVTGILTPSRQDRYL